MTKISENEFHRRVQAISKFLLLHTLVNGFRISNDTSVLERIFHISKELDSMKARNTMRRILKELDYYEKKEKL